MYPYDTMPQLLMNQNDYPLQRQGPPATSGQIQPSGLQPQPMPAMGMRPQIAALAQQYNPQFNPQAGMQPPMQPPMQPGNPQAQYQLSAQMLQGQQQMQQPWQNGVAFNTGWANNFQPMPVSPQLTAAQSALQQRYAAMYGMPGTPQAPTAGPQAPIGAPQQPMGGMGAGVGMASPYGGGVGGLSRFYRTR